MWLRGTWESPGLLDLQLAEAPNDQLRKGPTGFSEFRSGCLWFHMRNYQRSFEGLSERFGGIFSLGRLLDLTLLAVFTFPLVFCPRQHPLVSVAKTFK